MAGQRRRNEARVSARIRKLGEHRDRRDGSQLHQVWLRKVDIHFPNPDDATVQTARQLFDELRREIQRIRGAA
jgi:hypothetical protein